jgi:protein-S-isoprenylcysteine O-methyltransferase Ste14
MSTDIKLNPAKDHTNIARGVVRWAIQMSAAWIVFGALLFVAAGKLNWPAGWAYLGLNALTQILSSLVLIPRRPDMLAERSQIRAGTKGWDRFFAPAIVIAGTLAVLITAGLDERFGWSDPFSLGLWSSGLILAFCSQMFVLWAMASNPFFSTTVRIQADRGQSVTSSGPYRFVRHPGYFGSTIYNLVIPLVLDSAWTFIPALLTIGLIIIRTGLEDRTLKAELPGYQAYTEIVKHRLFPGLW